MTSLRRLLLLLTTCAFTVCPVFATAETVIIASIKNTNPKEVSSLSAECQVTTDGQRMTCNFVQVSVRMNMTPEAAAAEVQKGLTDFKPSEVGASCDRKETAQLREAMAKAPDVPARLKAFFAEWLRRQDAFCDKPSRETFRAFASYGFDKETRTCRISTNPWQETFTRSLGGKWVSNRGPSGICGVVIVSTLEPHDPSKPPGGQVLWTYHTQKIVTDKTVGQQHCFFDEAKVTYSWKAKDFDRSCEFIEFGF